MISICKFSASLMTGQIAVASESDERLFSYWTKAHCDQGFAWRPGSVGFMSLSDGGEAEIEVLRTHSLPEIEADAVRAIEVPFTSPDSGIIQIGGVADLHAVRLSPGSYLLRYEIKYAPDGEEGDDDRMACRLIFASGETPRFQIARADKYLRPPPRLVLTCDPI